MKELMLIDQTVAEAMRRGISPVKLQLMIKNVQQLKVGTIDVQVADWKRAKVGALDETLQPLIRGKVKAKAQAIEEAKQLGFRRLAISYNHRPGKSLSGDLCTMLAKARYLEFDISVFVENASALSPFELASFQPLLGRFGIDQLIFGDQDSCLDPFVTNKLLRTLQKTMPCSLEFHAHNGCGLATANTLAAIRAGIRAVATAVAGVGADGHAAAEEVLLGSKHLLQITVGSTNRMAEAYAKVISCMRVKLPVDKAIIGKDIFAHESGLHVDGVTKNPRLYEPFAPEEVGLSRRLVIGKHSGTASLQAKADQWNLYLGEQEAQQLLPKVRTMAVRQKGALTDSQLRKLLYETARHGKVVTN